MQSGPGACSPANQLERRSRPDGALTGGVAEDVGLRPVVSKTSNRIYEPFIEEQRCSGALPINQLLDLVQRSVTDSLDGGNYSGSCADARRSVPPYWVTTIIRVRCFH